MSAISFVVSNATFRRYGFCVERLWFLSSECATRSSVERSLVTADTCFNAKVRFETYKRSIDVPYVIYTFDGEYKLCVTPIAVGNYGMIFTASRRATRLTLQQSHHQSIPLALSMAASFIIVKLMPSIDSKQPATDVIEAFIHVLLQEVTGAIGMRPVVPRIHSVFFINTRSVGIAMEYVNGLVLPQFLERMLGMDPVINDYIILTLLAQIAAMLLPLQQILRFNHRDLHGRNIIMEPIAAPEVVAARIQVGDPASGEILTIPVVCGYAARIIDMGFSRVDYSGRTIGTTTIFAEPRGIPFSAGRDLCQFVAYLVCYVLQISPANCSIVSVVSGVVDGAETIGKKYPVSFAVRNFLADLTTAIVTPDPPPLTMSGVIFPQQPTTVNLQGPCSIWDSTMKKHHRIFPAGSDHHDIAWTNLYKVLNAPNVACAWSEPNSVIYEYSEFVSCTEKWYRRHSKPMNTKSVAPGADFCRDEHHVRTRRNSI